MSKKHKTFDYTFGMPYIIPSKQESYKNLGADKVSINEESEGVKAFRKIVSDSLSESLKTLTQFPTKKRVFIFILQHFVSQTEYEKRDVDNMAKTILDLLKDKFYYNDSQVSTLLVCKRMDSRIPDNFAYCAIKELRGSEDVEPVKICNIEGAVNLYYEVKKQAKIQ